MPQLPPPLPTNRAFVVQLRAQPPGAPMAWDGRVEHVVSGQMTHFHSLEELLASSPRPGGRVGTLKRHEHPWKQRNLLPPLNLDKRQC